MNNFVFSQDPLLFQSYQPKQQSQENFDVRQKQFSEIMQQYRQPPQPYEKDHLGDLDGLMKNLRPEIVSFLSSDDEYLRLNNELQGIIQDEIMSSIR